VWWLLEGRGGAGAVRLDLGRQGRSSLGLAGACGDGRRRRVRRLSSLAHGGPGHGRGRRCYGLLIGGGRPPCCTSF
jgi:hypothetical protein